MSLRRFKKKFADAQKIGTSKFKEAMDKAKEKVGEALNTDLTLDKAEQELIDDLEKGLRIFDEIGLPQERGDQLQEEIATHALEVLKANWPGDPTLKKEINNG
jgi:hypothetical protein